MVSEEGTEGEVRLSEEDSELFCIPNGVGAFPEASRVPEERDVKLDAFLGIFL